MQTEEEIFGPLFSSEGRDLLLISISTSIHFFMATSASTQVDFTSRVENNLLDTAGEVIRTKWTGAVVGCDQVSAVGAVLTR